MQLSQAGMPAIIAYFIGVLVVVNFLVVNLFVAVICTQFAAVRDKYEHSAFISRR